MTDSLLPLAAVLVSVTAIPLILASGRRQNLREAWTILAALAKVTIVASMVPGVLSDGKVYKTEIVTFVDEIEFALEVDPLGLLFGLLASALWVVTSFYSIGYMRGLDEHSQTRYFAAFAASLATAIGVAFAANLVTMFIFYELLTVATYPLVAHDETDEARAAGRKYLAYTFLGGIAVLAGTVLVFWMVGETGFKPGGIQELGTADEAFARLAFVLLVGGFGVKAAIMPAHSWLPDAMVAPTPVSGLLHAVAVVKSGVFGIARVTLEIYGPVTMQDLGVGLPLAVMGAFTLLTASIIALRKDNLKRRLAYSTISQLSYIVLGLGVAGLSVSSDLVSSEMAMIGALLHIPAHAFMKLTLFFCAGAIHVETHTDDISNMAGIGKRMPLTMTAFAIASAGMAGIPLIAGFVSKWYLLIGSVRSGYAIFAVALLVSGILNIAYFWPIVYQAFFEDADAHDEKPLLESVFGGTLATVGGTSDAVESPAEAVRADGGGESDKDATADGTETGDAAENEAHEENGNHEAHEQDNHHKDDEDHDHHHGGPPAEGWERMNWTGEESTWFMLGPILTAAAGAVALGIAPGPFVFLEIVETVAENVLEVVVA